MLLYLMKLLVIQVIHFLSFLLIHSPPARPLKGDQEREREIMMELSNEDGFLEELLGLGRETWGETNPTAEINTLFSNNCWGSSGCLNNNHSYFQDSATNIQLIPPAGTMILPPNTSTTAYHQDLSIDSIKPSLDEYSSAFNDEIYSALEAKFMAAAAAPGAEIMLASAADDSSHMRNNSSSNHHHQPQQLETSSSPYPPMSLQEEYSLSSIMEDDEPPPPPPPAGMQVQGDKNTTTNTNNYIEEMPLSQQQGTTCKVEPSCATHQCTEFNMGLMCMEYNNNNNKNSSSRVMKKLESSRQPSKNLMAERRRRKRLNDRLSMLRSVVPKISKMDRTSILGDTIDYMKELLEKINNLQEEMDVSSSPTRDQLSVVGIFKDLMKPNDVLVRNSPKFDVERRNMDTRVEICCAAKPGLLLSTISALEQLGLEIQQCVISCFNDFSLQASCSEEVEQRALISSEEVKQALFRNAGYGGRCL